MTAAADSYYTMTVRVPMADWLAVRGEIMHEGDYPGVHESSTQAAVTATFTWTFREEDTASSWSAYHAVVRAYSVCVARRLRCTFTTRGPDGKTYELAASPVHQLARRTGTA